MRAGAGARSPSPGEVLRRELIQVSAYFAKNWRMTRRNVFTVFEVVFFPMVTLLSVGLMTAFLGLGPEATVFVLVGTLALAVVQVCQLDVAYAVLFDMWAKSIKHEMLAPVRPWHLALGAWAMGLLRGVLVFVLLAAASGAAFGVSFLRPGWAALAFLLGLLVSAAGIGLLVCTLLLLFGLRAEVSAWSGVSLLLLLSGIYYPVSLLPGPLVTVAGALPMTYFLEAFRAHYGFAPVFPQPFLRGSLVAGLYLVVGYLAFAWAVARCRRTGMLLRLSD
jgi:ABC-2 type transport system permease protein